MGIITKVEAKEFVIAALREVADFNTDDVDNFSFSEFTDFQIHVFSEVLNQEIESENYSITLNHTIISSWDTVGDCIDYVEENIFMNF